MGGSRTEAFDRIVGDAREVGEELANPVREYFRASPFGDDATSSFRFQASPSNQLDSSHPSGR